MDSPGGTDSRAAALGGEEELAAARAEVAADQLLAAPVVNRGVDQVDPRVEQLVEQPSGVLVGDRRTAQLARRTAELAAQLHRAVTQDRHLDAGAT